MVDMGDNWKTFITFIFGVMVGLWVAFGVVDKGRLEYAIVEDNAVETIISIKQGDDLTLINVNRFEDGGGLWVTTYDGKGVPESVRIENAKEIEND